LENLRDLYNLSAEERKSRIKQLKKKIKELRTQIKSVEEKALARAKGRITPMKGSPVTMWEYRASAPSFTGVNDQKVELEKAKQELSVLKSIKKEKKRKR
jgi:hypothetical protein